MKRIALTFSVCVVLLLASCERDTTFLITETSVGPLEQGAPLEQMESIFGNDSVVRDTFRFRTGEIPKKLKIFEKGGRLLLTLTPNNDSIPSIENVKIEDDRYKTAKGIGLISTFKEVQEQYTIKKIATTLNSVVLFPKESNLYFSIDKGQLPENLRYSNSTIEAVQIPDAAKVKYLMVAW